MQQKKRIKSVKKFSDLPSHKEILKKDGKLKSLDKKYAVSIARKLATGFENDDLRKTINNKSYKKARKIITEWYEATRGEKVKIVRPAKGNRKLYSEYADMSSNFKVYAVPVFDERDRFEIIGRGDNKRVKRIGEFSSTEFFKFPDQKKLIQNPKTETNKVFSKIDKQFGKENYAVKIKCGRHEFKTLYKDKSPHIEIENWIQAYGATRVKKFCLGFQVYTFKNQQEMPSEKMLKKGDKKKKRKGYAKAKGR